MFKKLIDYVSFSRVKNVKIRFKNIVLINRRKINLLSRYFNMRGKRGE